MKLSDLIKQASSAVGTYANTVGGPGAKLASGGLNMLQNSINKSSPGFKATTTTQAGTPVAVPASERADLQGFDYYANLAKNATKPETKAAANDWLKRNLLDDTQSVVDTTDTDAMQYDFGGGSDIDFSTPTSQVAYSAEKMNELFGTKSPEDLFAMREMLRRKAALAEAGLLPEEEYMQYQGLPGLEGEQGYSFNDTIALNRATADIFSNAAVKADKAITQAGLDAKTQASAGGLSFGGMEPWQQSIINATSVGSTKDERNANRQDLIMAASQGADAFVQALIGKGEANLKGTQLDEFNSRITNVAALQSALSSLESSGIKLSNFRSVRNRAEQIFGKQSPEYAAVQMLFEQVSASERNKIFGASLTGNEQAAANKFVINDKDTNETAIVKAQKMIGVMNYANDITALKATGATRQKIDEWQKAGYLKTFDEYTGGTSKSSGGDTFEYNGQTYKKNPDGSATLVSFSQVGGGTNIAQGIVAGYNIAPYATDPLHEKKVATIYQKTPQFKSPKDIDMVIRQVAPKSKITGNMIATAASTYGVDPKMVYAIMLQDSSLGTAGMGARNNNPGNIGQFDHLGQPVAGYKTMQDGVNAVAKWLSKKRVADQKQYT